MAGPVWGAASEHRKKYYPKLLHVCSLATCGLALDDLRILDVWRASNYLKRIVLLEARRKSKVCEFDLSCLSVDNNLFYFQITVNQLQAMHISYRAHYLLEQELRGALSQERRHRAIVQLRRSSMLQSKLVERLAQTKLHDQVHIGLGVDDLIEPHDVGMVHACQDVDLPMNCHKLTFLRQLLLLVRLQCELVASLPVRAFLDDGVNSVADLVMDGKVSAQVEDGILAAGFQSINRVQECVLCCGLLL